MMITTTTITLLPLLISSLYMFSRGAGGMANQAATGMQAAFGNMQQQVQKAAVNAAASAAAAEVEKQMTSAIRGGFRK